MAQPPAPDVDDDFALSESEDADMAGDDALSDLSDPTMDEIDEWARVDAPTVLSGSSQNGSEDKQDDDVPAMGTAPTSTSDPSLQPSQDAPDAAADPAKQAPASKATDEDHSSAALGESQQRGEGSSSKRLGADSQQEVYGSDADDDGGETSPAGAWGWSGSDWGLKAIGGKLKEVAAGAVRDVKELKDSLQQALNEAAVATDEEDEYVAGSAPAAVLDPIAADVPLWSTAKAPVPVPEPVPGQRQHSEAGAAAGSSAAAEAGAAAEGDDEDDEQRRQEVLSKLQGPDTKMEVGLRAIDDQVEQLATGAARAIGSIWGGLGGLAKDFAKEFVAGVEEVGKDMSQLHAVKAAKGAAGAVTKLGTKIATTAERSLETVGRTAAQMLEEVNFNSPQRSPTARATNDSEFSCELATIAEQEAVGFVHSFYLYGGRSTYEDIEMFSNECAKACNRARARMEPERRAEVDTLLTALAPVFDLASEAGGDECEWATEAVQQQLEDLYVPISALCQSGRVKAARLGNKVQQELAAAVAAGVEAREAAEAAAAAEDEDEDEDGVDVEPLVVKASVAVEQELGAALHKACTAVVTAMGNSLAEVCSAQIELLLDLGRNIAQPDSTARVAEGQLEWPEDSAQLASLLRYNAVRMMEDLRDVAQGYSELVPLLREAAGQQQEQQQEPQEAAAAAGKEGSAEAGAQGAGSAAAAAAAAVPGGKQHLAALEGSISLDATIATARVQDSFRCLLYVVLRGSIRGTPSDSGAEAEQTEAEAVQQD